VAGRRPVDLSAAEEPQVSWKVIESGTPIVGSDGEKAGTVSRIVGDPDADVFSGLAIKVGILSGERSVPSERVRGIWADRIEVDFTKAELETLPPFEDAPVVRVEPDEPGFFARLFGRR
jgi:PRC-barrel domain